MQSIFQPATKLFDKPFHHEAEGRSGIFVNTRIHHVGQQPRGLLISRESQNCYCTCRADPLQSLPKLDPNVIVPMTLGDEVGHRLHLARTVWAASSLRPLPTAAAGTALELLPQLTYTSTQLELELHERCQAPTEV